MAYTTSGQWTFPLEETNGNARRPPPRPEHTTSSISQERMQSAAYREPKGGAAQRRAPSDTYNIMSDSEEVKQRRASLKTNNSAAGKKRSRNTLRDAAAAAAAGGKGAAAAQTQGEYVDDSAWIHRDKLAQIEIQEMEEAGLYIRPARRSMSVDPATSRRSSRSASRSRRPMSDSPPDEPLPNGGYIASHEMYDDMLDKPLPSTPAAQEGERDFDPDVDTEFRTPEEIAAELGSMRNTNSTGRPSTSRIPISKASPVPVPSTVVGRDSPLPRSRHGSGAGSGNWDEMQYARRARSSSMGSQAILDEDAFRTPPAPGSPNKLSSSDNSPPKSRVPTKAVAKSGARKASGTNGADRPGSSYGKERKTSTPSQRPVSRSGPGQKNGRPSTSHQHTPEGDPPWIDSMYKPDPRLPPDQQMLPTHAKRMMQEQWEKEGKGGTTYDRELNLLNDKELPKPKPKPLNLSPADNTHRAPSESPRRSDARLTPSDAGASPNANAWPLTSKSDTDMPPPSPRPSTSGGFKLTPKITSPPILPKVGSPPAAMQAPQSTLRVPELDEKQEAQQKKGGCACCVVM